MTLQKISTAMDEARPTAQQLFRTQQPKEVTEPWLNEPVSEEEIKLLVDELKKKKYYDRQILEYSKKVSAPRTFPIHTSTTFAELIKQRFEKKNGFPFVIDEYNTGNFLALCLYFTGDKRFEDFGKGYSLDKGLLIQGGVGIGKTTMMKMFCMNQHASFQIVNCMDVADAYSQHGALEIDRYRALKEAEANHPYGVRYVGYCFDDLGTETIPATNFGEKRNVMTEILLGRYARRQDYNLTHITTNLSLEAMTNIYGSRVIDRMSDMFNQIIFEPGTPSRRK